MRFTKRRLNEMSDFEINKALAERLYKGAIVTRAVGSFNAVTIEDADVPLDCVAYCSSWADIMPLAVKFNITYVQNEGVACANLGFERYGYFTYDEAFEHNSPQRAIACCILMMWGD